MIADRYADALFQAATAQGDAVVTRVDEDLAAISGLLADHPALAELWQSPVSKVSQKQAAARSLFDGRVHPLTLNTLLLLFEKKRGMLVRELQVGFRRLLDATRRRAQVQVVSAQALADDQSAALRQQLERQLGLAIDMDTAVDPDLLGGLVVKIDDQVIDHSLRGRLDALRLSLS
ncbi:MAG: ATP synthase F1 subunit delta [Candidatus Sericytochromatia bacterium]|nr:ATP synthase F1 subunit delta [Candidatus Sericytochromatia bacterium]